MSDEQVEQSSDGTQLNIESTQPAAESTTFPRGQVENAQFEAEQKAFKTYVENSGEPIPENFKDVESWFGSLKEAQSNYTKGQQEISKLREEYAANGPREPEQPEPVAEAEPMITPDSPELRIPDQVVEETTKAAESVGVDSDSYEAWGVEMAQTGTLSEPTRQEIRNKTGFTDNMIDDYMAGQKARLKENFAKASTVVGGRDKLQQIFEWAGKELSPEQQQQINMGLASPSYEVTLRGLSSLYEDNVKSAKVAEPSKNEKLTTMSASETGTRGYISKREFTADRNNPKFNMEPKFRHMVESRMSITDWNHLPA